MKAPKIGTEWQLYDGALVKVTAIEGRAVHCRVLKRGTNPGSGGRRRGPTITFVRSDFHNELYDSFLRRVA